MRVVDAPLFQQLDPAPTALGVALRWVERNGHELERSLRGGQLDHVRALLADHHRDPPGWLAEHNRAVREKVSNLRRSLRKATEARDEAKASETLQKMYSALDKAAKVGVIHKRTAARRKSRLSRVVAKLKTS